MRALRFLNVAILSALVGGTALLYAQDEKQEEKPARQEDSKPQPKQDEAKPAHKDEAKPARPEQEKQDPKREDQSRDQMRPEGQEHPDQRMEHARPETQEQGHPEQAQRARPAGKGGHIPDDRFRAHFGNGHHFRAQGVIMQGQSQFQYGGYTFQLVDAWPVGWAYTDDCYIDYIDGEYFLFDLLHPGIRIAIVVVL
jgi:DNA mismatch repair ATPase MutL